jgi:hypothetical protein
VRFWFVVVSGIFSVPDTTGLPLMGTTRRDRDSGAGQLTVELEMEQNLGPSRIAERQIGIVVKPLAIGE